MPDKRDGDKSKTPGISRLAKMRADLGDESFVPPMPPCTAQYLLDYLNEAGPCGYGGFGAVPLMPSEILAWSSLSGVCLQPWEAMAIRGLSIAYCSELVRARDPDAKPPWEKAPHIKPAAEVIVARLKAAF